MSIEDHVRLALKLLNDQGLINSVIQGPLATYGEDGLVPPGTPITVILNADDPESYRPEIEKLLQNAGLHDIRLNLKANPLHGQNID